LRYSEAWLTKSHRIRIKTILSGHWNKRLALLTETT
jgi:hypothetical protein